MKKLRVCIICGGRSGEHEVSLQSTRNIINAMSREKYEIIVIGIDKEGRWALYDPSDFLLHPDDPRRISLGKALGEVVIDPGNRRNPILTKAGDSLGPVDVVFPVLHGPYGEDGTVQGLLDIAGIPFVGAGVLGSAIGMDKDVMKRLLRDAGIPIGRFMVLSLGEGDEIGPDEIVGKLGLPLFVKPARYGSSIGISKVEDKEALPKAMDLAFEFDRKVVIEEFIEGREIECSVLGNDDPVASMPGEIIPQKDFYSYEAKYIDDHGAILKAPADLEPRMVDRIKDLAIRAYSVLCCEGMARVDMFLKRNNEVLVNEINTIPGFTRISMYPRLWEESGMGYGELIDRLIELALEKFRGK
ncbi:MAG: D-alanine--D-alanine ligase [Deltaproteobacteria bacterium]|nr:D-alanine--D-alanine ligase [Deltaproteobacteria bacterium]MBW2136082.1 D-alanine--D-alanine ligase [Deltaproteobacteria bacterium]